MDGQRLNLVEVADLGDSRLADYAGMRDAELAHRESGASAGGRFMAEGELVVRRLIDSPYSTLSVLLTPARLTTMADALRRLPEGTPIYLVRQQIMNSVVGFNMHRGVLASAARGEGATAEEVLARCRTLVALEGLTNHDNVGGIFRSAAALGHPPAGVLLSPGCCDPLYRKSVRVSMGHALGIPFATLAPWPDGLRLARDAGYRIIAMTPSPDSVPIETIPPAAGTRMLLLLGAEGPGLSPAAMAASDQRVRIPLAAGVDSLNVAVAAAIALQRLCPLV